MTVLNPLWEQKALEEQEHAKKTKAHIGKMIEDGCTHILAAAYNTGRNDPPTSTIIVIVGQSGQYVDTNGEHWDAAYPINIYGEPLSVYEYELIRHSTLLDNGLKHTNRF